jgi:hypothetical protein
MSHDAQQYARALWSGKENLTNSIRFLFSSFGLTIQKSFFYFKSFKYFIS